MARATHQGEFVAMPAEVYAMYDLTTWGRSASGRLHITPAESGLQTSIPDPGGL